jgi:uncharacterized protein (DUF111 family)
MITRSSGILRKSNSSSRSKLSAWVKQKSIAVFQRIAEAEGKIHGLPPNEVHFTKSARWIPSWTSSARPSRWNCSASRACSPRRWSKAPAGFAARTAFSRSRAGHAGDSRRARHRRHAMRGTARTRHAHRRGAAGGICRELRPMENLVAEKIGFGLGTRDNKTRPECVARGAGNGSDKWQSPKSKVQSVTVTPSRVTLDWETDRVAVLETNLDDCPGEILGAFVETALAAGALDVFHTPIQMKKNRPGVLLTVLCAEADADKFSELILRETTAFGVRKTIAERRKLRREFAEVKTAFGKVT